MPDAADMEVTKAMPPYRNKFSGTCPECNGHVAVKDGLLKRVADPRNGREVWKAFHDLCFVKWAAREMKAASSNLPDYLGP